MIRKVLVATDGSRDGNAAVDFAAFMASGYESELVLQHVVHAGEIPRDILQRAEQRLEDEDEQVRLPAGGEEARQHRIEAIAGELILADARQRAKRYTPASITTLLDKGSPVEQIVAQAEDVGADLIVVGTRGHSDWHDVIMGSVSHGVLIHAPCTSACIHADQAPADWGKIKRILVPTDGSEHAEKAVAFGANVATKLDAGMTLVHTYLNRIRYDKISKVISKREISTRAWSALHSENITKDVIEEIGEAILDRGARIAGEHGVGDVRRVAQHGDAASATLALARQDKADLIVMGMRGLSGLPRALIGSVSYKVSHRAPCPTIVVR